jgi:predicted O-methyltransferase YrrM
MIHTAESLRAAFKYLFVEELVELQRLARMLPDNPVVVNIGAGAGTSGLAFRESRPDLWLFTVDKQRAESPLGCLVAEEKVLRDAGLWDDQVQQIHGDSKEFGSNWLGDPVDMVFVDGDHSYEGCAGDIEAWIPNLKPGGLLAVHDFNKEEVFGGQELPDAPFPKPWPGVDQAVEALLVGKYEMVSVVRTLVTFRV